MSDASEAQILIDRLVAEFGDEAHTVLDEILGGMDPLEVVALFYDWAGFWSRGKQRLPLSTWRTFGFLAARGFGKTRAIAEWINDEVEAGHHEFVALIAQNEDKSLEIQVEGHAGLIATAPPWFKPKLERGVLVWPNGAEATIFTPQEPDNIRGPEHDLVWASELIAWPKKLARKALMNLRLGLRRGRRRFVWDTTPRRGNQLLRILVAQWKADPERHVIVAGGMHENESNLGDEFIEDMVSAYGGTQEGDEEIDGIYSDEDAGALWSKADIDHGPVGTIERQVISVDPAISTRRGTDATGIIRAAKASGRFCVREDYSARYEWEAWGDLVIDEYAKHRCDTVIVERNRGGDACIANLRACGKLRDPSWTVTKLEKDEQPPRHRPGIIYVREVIGRGSKADRARPVVTLYQKRRAFHERGAVLEELEALMTTWDPGETDDSPNPLDAAVHAAWELMDLTFEAPDPTSTHSGLEKLNQIARRADPLSELLGRRRGRGGL